jgi:hypothetical protein
MVLKKREILYSFQDCSILNKLLIGINYVYLFDKTYKNESIT